MLDLLELLHQFLSDGLSWASVTAIILAVIKIKDSQHKKKVNVQLAEDIRAIKERLGCADTLNAGSSDSAPRNEKWWRWRLVGTITALFAGKYIKLKRVIRMKLKNINKAILLPLLAAIATFVKHAFGYEISDELINTIADVVLYLLMFIGVFIKPTKGDGGFDYSSLDDHSKDT